MFSLAIADSTARTQLSHNLVKNLKGRNGFFDDETLRKGQSNWETIQGALRASKIVVVVLSKHYQESPWCLEELRIALSLKEVKVLVVFYGAGVQSVREVALKSSFAQWRRKHPGAPQGLKEAWKEALLKVQKISGWIWDEQTGWASDLFSMFCITCILELTCYPI
jgi:hypothetical protein